MPPIQRTQLCSVVVAFVVLCGCGRAPVELTAHRDVPYDERFGELTTLDAYVPLESTGAARPAVMLVHGGGWSSGSKAEMTSAARRLAESGFVTVSVNYQLAPNAPFPRALRDVRCALSFVRSKAAEWNLDPARVATLGYSAGGNLVSMLGVSDTNAPELRADCAAGNTGPPAAVISADGVQDLRALGNVGATVDYLGGTLVTARDRFEQASPITWVSAGAPPFLLISGSADWYVSVQQQLDMRDALSKAQVPVTLVVVPGGGHVTTPSAASAGLQFDSSMETPEAWAATIDFLDSTIGAPP